jgi:NAD(P)-dependent dehydrogenase (short-subunit alcohol dehydrogenase family)
MPVSTNLSDVRAVVTGGTSGLGLALVRLLAARGARVAFVARTGPAVDQVACETGGYGIVGDMGCKEDIYPIALQITGNLGGLDVLINNASSLGPTPLALLADTECSHLARAIGAPTGIRTCRRIARDIDHNTTCLMVCGWAWLAK